MAQQENYIKSTKLEGVYLINRPLYPDDRGSFHEVFRLNDLEEVIKTPFKIVQWNHSKSTQNVLRGIHTAPWSKLFYCVEGKVQQVVVDLRPDSSTYGKYISNIIGTDNPAAIYVPPNCGNAFLVLSKEADCCYMVDDYWKPGMEYGVTFDDPDLKVDWQVQSPLLSEKDKLNKKLRELFPEHFQ